MKIKVTCPSCGREFEKEFEDSKIERYKNGELVQRVFPELTPVERELFFISHICGDCWDNMFSEEDEEYYDTE